MKRCETPQMSLLPAKCSGGLTALKTNTSKAQGTADQRLSTHTGPGTGMEVRHSEWAYTKRCLVNLEQHVLFPTMNTYLLMGHLTLTLCSCVIYLVSLI